MKRSGRKSLRLKASSMYYALFLSVIIGLFLGAIVLFSAMNRQFTQQLDLQNTLIDNAYSGIEYGMANHLELNNETTEITLFGGAIDSVLIEKKKWGAFTIISSQAHHRKFNYTKVALTGAVQSEDYPNLYVSDQGRPISICGNTRLEGDCKIPKSGLKRTYIEGKSYTGKKLIYGSKGVSKRELSKISDDLASGFFNSNGFLMNIEDEDTIANSFQNEPLHFISDHTLTLNDRNISGQVILEARDSIFVSSSSNLEDVILKSKVVHIESGFEGNVQVFATKRITIEEDVVLRYPSVLGLIEQDGFDGEKALIKIGDRSTVIGSVFAISEKPNFRNPVQVSVESEAFLHGLLYCDGRTQLKGTVNGSLQTDMFYLETPSSKYENHILDGQVLDQLPDDFVFVSLIESDNALTPLCWLE
jgi:hypothetical protein